MKKQYKSSIIQNHKVTHKKIFDGIPLKGYVASKVIFRFCARNEIPKSEGPPLNKKVNFQTFSSDKLTLFPHNPDFQ